MKNKHIDNLEVDTIMSYYFGHDASITIYRKKLNKIFHLSLPSIFQKKHIKFRTYISNDKQRAENMLKYVEALIIKNLSIEKIDLVIHPISHYHNQYFDFHSYEKNGNDDKKIIAIEDKDFLEASTIIKSLRICKDSIHSHSKLSHHDKHLWCGYALSGFKKAVVLTQDGMGDGEHFVISKMNNEEHLDRTSYFNTSGLAYNSFSLLSVILWNSNKDFHYVRSLEKAIDDYKKNKPDSSVLISSSKYLLDSNGKGMGMSRFEKPDQAFIDTFSKLFADIAFSQNKELRKDYGDFSVITDYFKNNSRFYKEATEYSNILSKSIEEKRQFAKWLMWVAQDELEKNTLSILHLISKSEYKEYDNNLVLSGGVALNVLLNEKIKNTFPYLNIYVPPNPGDDGLSMGEVMRHIYGKKPDSILYSGLPVMRTGRIDRGRITNIQEISDLLARGKIIGVIQGRSEIGPRALGNRSILADPKYLNMRDKINNKVKNRELYRPFAPVCRKEDASKYFDSVNYEGMEAMSFCPRIKPEYANVFPSIVHVDETCRLQTVESDSSPFLYELLTVHPTDILLNTSLNLAGKPLCNTMEDAFSILDNTQLDYLVWKHRGEFYIEG
jgi:predicted NodU family carbamoyl transferase